MGDADDRSLVALIELQEAAVPLAGVDGTGQVAMWHLYLRGAEAFGDEFVFWRLPIYYY